ncbi:MAG: thiamine diphosphokinase [Bacteroidales bacterium]|nr:thiamine diphosphokinase [Bacteroidales bacterium]MBP5675510.1 thiamine diphosphokinase [Bacteroidales bacterium]
MNGIVILCNGAFPTEPYPLYLLDSAEGVVCCDGAVEKWLEHNQDAKPLVIVGDMDSLPQDLQARFSGIVFHEEEQDYNDLTKAMRWVLREHPEVSEITILGATGLREDHTIGNLGLLMEYTRLFDLRERKVTMVSDYGTAFAITNTCDLHLGEGRRISLFSADNTLRISSTGLQWPTDDVVFDAWWKATLNRTTEPIVTLRFNHPSAALVIID